MYDNANKQNIYFERKAHCRKPSQRPCFLKFRKLCPEINHCHAEEFRAYMKERDRKHKAYDTAERTVKVMYKSLCPACEYNATHGKKIIYNCPNCKVRYWNNCSKNQVKNGGILSALQSKYGNIEWVKAYNPDGTLYYEWKRHESRYKQDIDGRWIPKD